MNKKYIVILTQTEAESMHLATGIISGSPYNTIRTYTDKIWIVLQQMGFKTMGYYIDLHKTHFQVRNSK